MYSNPPYLQRSILGGLWRSFVGQLLWHDAKTVDTEALATGRNILTSMSDPNAKFRDVVRRNVHDPAYRVLKSLRVQVRKRKSIKIFES